MDWFRRTLGKTPAEDLIDSTVPQADAAAAEARSVAAKKAAATRAAKAPARARKAAVATRREERAQAEAAAKAAQRAFRRRFGPASSVVGLFQTSENFECSECGRWASVVGAAAVYAKLVEGELDMPRSDWQRVTAAAGAPRHKGRDATPMRPAYLQREFSKDYDEAVRVLEAGVRLGLLDATAKGVIAAYPKCSDCYERRAAETAPDPAAASSRDPIPPQLRFRVLQRDAFRCQYCGRSARDGATLHLDHVVPVAAGGATTEDNLITACDTCNLGKSARDVV